MTSLQAAVLYVGLNIVLLMTLKFYVGSVRMREGVAAGDGGNVALQRAMRVQGNAIEDIPVVLAGLIGLAAIGGPALLIHLLGATLVAARVTHAVALAGSNGPTLGRKIGTLGTMLVMLITALACIWYGLTG